MSADDLLAAVLPVLGVFERLGVRYYIGGSIASSAWGIARASLDVDVVADLDLTHVAEIVAALRQDYYLDAARIRSSILERRAFNLIHLSTMFKIDVFASRRTSFDESALQRAQIRSLSDDGSACQPIASPEDTVLAKLDWYRPGGESSERQWTDVIGVLDVMQEQLDRSYLRSMAIDLGLETLLDRAFAAVQD